LKSSLFLVKIALFLGLVSAFVLPGHNASAQWESGDSYDPFADYSDFNETADEEADINFFKNGRLFTMGMFVGVRGFTSEMGNVYSNDAAFGLFLSYFFDLRFAMQLGFATGDHGFKVEGPTTILSGNAALTEYSLNLKYFFNTQNVTKGLAKLNPYATFGFSQISRTVTIPSNSAFNRDSANGLNVGLGIEIPAMRNKMYWGLQATYQLMSFPDESTEIFVEDGSGNLESTGVTPKGDPYTGLLILGLNF